MCPSLFAPKAPKPVASIVPAAPAAPTRQDEENRVAVDSELELMRRRRGTQGTILTGGLGDVGYGSSAVKKTALGG